MIDFESINNNTFLLFIHVPMDSTILIGKFTQTLPTQNQPAAKHKLPTNLSENQFAQ